jgi:hypothetical protein
MPHEEVRGAHHVVGILGDDGAFLAAHRFEHGERAGQTRGVRARGSHARLRAAGLHDEQRLARAPRGGE